MRWRPPSMPWVRGGELTKQDRGTHGKGVGDGRSIFLLDNGEVR